MKGGRGRGLSEVAFQEGEGLRFHQEHPPNQTSVHMSKGTAFKKCGKSGQQEQLLWSVASPVASAAVTSRRPFRKERNCWLFTRTPPVQGLGYALTFDLRSDGLFSRPSLPNRSFLAL